MPKKDPLNGNNTYASSLGKESTAQMSNSGTEDSEDTFKEEDKTLISETNDSDFDKDFQEKYSQKDVTADPNSNKNGDRESTDQASKIGTEGSKDILTENGEPLKFEEPENVVNITTNRSQNENEHPIHYEVHENDPNTGKAVFDISTPSKREDSVSISENDSTAINEDAEDNCANPNDSEILHKKSTDKLSRNVSEGSGEKPSEEILQENKESVKLDESENSINIMAKQSQEEKQQVVQYETLENDNDTPKAVLNVVTTTEKSIPSNIEASNDSQFDKVAQETFSQNGVTADTNDNRSNITDTLSHSVIPKEFPLETNNINELFLDKDSTEQVSKSDNEVLRDISGENEAVFKSKYSDNSVDNMTKRIHDENKQNIDFELQENTKELISDEQPSVQDSKDGTEYSKDVPSIEHVNRDKEPEAINDSLKNISKLSLENCGNEVSSHLKENEEYLQHATSVLANDLEATTSEYIMPSTTTDKTLENNLGGMAEKNSQISRPTINKSSISNDDPDSAEIHAHDTSMKNTSITENCDIQNVNREKVNDHIENKEEALVSNDSFFRSEINENNASTENAADSATVLQSEINNNNTEENVKNETNNFEEVEHDKNMSGKPAILYSNPREMSHPENLDETNNFAEGEHDIKTSGKPANPKDNLHPENLEPENIFTISINKDNTNSSCDNIVTNDKLGEDINKITKHESETTPVSKIDNLGSTIIADSTISNVKADLENDNISSEETENGILRHVTNDDVDPKLEDSKDTINSDTNVDNKSAIPSEEVVENSNAIKTKENNIESDLSIDTAKNLESFDRDLKVDNENLDEDGAQPILVTIRDVQVDITSEDSQGTSDRNIENIEPEMLTIDQDIDDAAPKYINMKHIARMVSKICSQQKNASRGGSVTVDNAATLENRSTTEIDPQECNNKIQASNNSLDGVHLISPTSETSSKISNNIDMSMEECHESIKEKKILQETTLESLNNMDPPTTERSNEVVQIKKELQVSDDSKRDDANCVRGPSLSEEKKDTDLKQVSQEVNTLTHDAQVTNQTSMKQIANIDDVTRHDTHEAVGTPEVEYRVKRDTILISDTSHLDDGQNEKECLIQIDS
ncbi:putative uncharacterized protein DDB_G0282133 [Musca domestica]|uniref:Uncharacterized protein n=1 Tax=Musca domestica TaxID=7370 RepID=A0ABM3V0X1_MUSDO|nr:putative uncharacterized protein DDB_G0282133 [Musca domestica]